MMEFLFISNVFLWITLIALLLINYALIRQIGVLYERVAPAGALIINKQLKAGDTAPVLKAQTIDGKIIDIGDRNPEGRSQLLFFASPDCPVCKTLIPALKSAAKAESDWIDIVFASDGLEQDHARYVTQHRLEGFAYIVSELLGKSYGVSKLPYAVVIDEYGKIASLGLVNSREHLDSLFEAKEQKVASLQDYLDKKSITRREG